MDRPPFAEEIEAAWGSVAAAYARLRQEAEAAVATWRFAEIGEAAGDPRPYYAERQRTTRTVLVPRPEDLPYFDPEAPHVHAALGFDAEGRLRLLLDLHVVVVVPGAGHVDSYTFDAGFGDWGGQSPSLRRIGRQTFADGRLAAYHEYERPADAADGDGWSSEQYAYDDDGRLVEIRGARVSAGGLGWSAPAGERVRHRDELRWDRGGELAEIVHHAPTGGSVTVWRRPPADLAPLVARVEVALGEAVVAWTHERWPDGGAFALALGSATDGWLPPSAILVTEAELRERLAEASAIGDDAVAAWAPQEFATFTDDLAERLTPRAAEELAIVEQERTLGDDEDAGWAVIDALAARLARRDWSDLPGGDRLLVYAADMTDDFPVEQVTRLFPADRVAELRARGWLT